MGARQCGGFDRNTYAPDARLAPFSAGSVKEDVGHFGYVAFMMQLILIGFYCMTEYEFADITVFDGSTALQFFLGIMIFMILGLGLAGSWMRAFGVSAFGFGLMIIAYALQEAILIEGWLKNETFHLRVSVLNFLTASSAVVAVLISWGALAGKISPLNMLWFSSAEIVIFYLNKVNILADTFAVNDVGGCMSVFVFGACYGVSCSIGMGLDPVMGLAGSTYASEVFANLGTGIMWIFFPTYLASNVPMNTAEQRTVILNTIFALLGSTGAAFASGPIFNPRGTTLTGGMLRLATLSGAVTVSCVANFAIGPGGALIIGTIGGTVSSFLVHMQAERRPLVAYIQKMDTYGVTWLFLVPGKIGVLVSMVLPEVIATTEIIWTDQLLGLLCTISLASISGFIVGRITRISGDLFPVPDLDFNDQTYWNTPEDIPNWGSWEGN